MCQLCHACKGIKVLVQWTCGLVQCAMRTGGEVQNCKEVKHILSRRSRYPPTFISQSPTHHGCQSCKRYVWTIMDHDNYGPSTTYDSSKLDNPPMSEVVNNKWYRSPYDHWPCGRRYKSLSLSSTVTELLSSLATSRVFRIYFCQN